MLDEVKESIINAYELKTGMSRAKLSHLMDNETWMNANKAVELGFADKVLFADNGEPADDETAFAWKAGLFSRAAVTNSLLGKIPKPAERPAETEPPQTRAADATPIEWLEKRLSLISH